MAGILAALVQKNRTGKGQVVEASLLRTGMWVIGGDLGTQEILGKVRQPAPRDENPTPLVNCYQSSDDRWFYLIGVEANRHFGGLMRAIEREELIDDERFRSAQDLVKNRRAIIAILDDAFNSKPMDHWQQVFDAHDVWWAPIQSPAEVLEDPQAEAVGAFVRTRDMTGNEVRSVASPINFHGHTSTDAPPAPDLGQHTTEILTELGFSADQIESMNDHSSAAGSGPS